MGDYYCSDDEGYVSMSCSERCKTEKCYDNDTLILSNYSSLTLDNVDYDVMIGRNVSITNLENITIMKNIKFVDYDTLTLTKDVTSPLINIYLKGDKFVKDGGYIYFNVSGLKAPVIIHNDESDTKEVRVSTVYSNFKTVNLVGKMKYSLDPYNSPTNGCYYTYSSRYKENDPANLTNEYEKGFFYSFSIGNGNYRHFYCPSDQRSALENGYMKESETEEYDSGKETTLYFDSWDVSSLFGTTLLNIDIHIKNLIGPNDGSKSFTFQYAK